MAAIGDTWYEVGSGSDWQTLADTYTEYDWLSGVDNGGLDEGTFLITLTAMVQLDDGENAIGALFLDGVEQPGRLYARNSAGGQVMMTVSQQWVVVVPAEECWLGPTFKWKYTYSAGEVHKGADTKWSCVRLGSYYGEAPGCR